MAGTPEELARDASRAAEPDLLAPGERVDRFVVRNLLGEGGMARVYEVEDPETDERFALKVLKVPHEAIRQRLVMEGRAQGKLTHPSIVRVFSIIDVRAAPGLVMELVDAVDLDIRLEKGPLKPEELDILGTQLLDGLAYAHRQRVIHRDIKPANVLMGAGQAKLTDFGLARLLDDSGGARVTRSGMTMGTPAYMPPEQIKDAKAVDERGDVYSLGALLFEAATGQCPFDGDDLLQVLTKVAHGDRPSIRELAPHLPRRIHRAIERALDPNVETRLQSVEAMRGVWRGEVEAPDTLVELPSPIRNSVSWVFGLSIGALLTMAALVGLLVVVGVAWVMQPEGRPRPVAPPITPVIAAHDPGELSTPGRTEEAAEAEPERATSPRSRYGSVSVQGDARVVLRGAAGVLPPGRVPVGRYELEATFGSGDVDKLDVRVGSGQRLVVRCDAVFKECELRR